MKKNILIMVLVFGLFTEFIFAQQITKVEPLKENETLDYTFDTASNILHVFRIFNERKVSYFDVKGSGWGMYQITEDKKGLLFFEDNFEEKLPMYYLDGRKGTVTSYGNIKFGAILDKTGKYVLFQESGLSDFYILNLETGKTVKKMSWNIKDKEKWYKRGARFFLFRAADKDDYDFMITFDIEYLSLSEGYINVEKDKMYTEYDDTDKTEVELRSSVDYGSDFTGWY